MITESLFNADMHIPLAKASGHVNQCRTSKFGRKMVAGVPTGTRRRISVFEIGLSVPATTK